MSRTNPTYMIKYPSEIKANPECKILHTCHPEAQIRIMEEHEKILATAIVPTVERPKRLSRVG